MAHSVRRSGASKLTFGDTVLQINIFCLQRSLGELNIGRKNTVVKVCSRARPSPRHLGFHEQARGQNAQMNITFDELQDEPKKTTIQQIKKQYERQMCSLRQIQEIHVSATPDMSHTPTTC